MITIIFLLLLPLEKGFKPESVGPTGSELLHDIGILDIKTIIIDNELLIVFFL